MAIPLIPRWVRALMKWETVPRIRHHSEIDQQRANESPARAGLYVTLWAIFLGPWVLALLMPAMYDVKIPLVDIGREVAVSQIHFLVYGTFLYTAVVYVRSRPPIPWVLKGIAFFVIACAASLISVGLCQQLGLHMRSELSESLVPSMGIGVTVSGIVLLIEWSHHRFIVVQRERDRGELERERALRLMAEARWNSLESRMRPHFLFNTLSSIRELMHQDVELADRMIERFSELVRFSLDAAGLPETSLEEELRMAEGYLEIERMRLGRRLRWQIDSPPDLNTALVPSLSILTLAENAVKHAVASRRAGGEIAVRVRGDHQQLRVEVMDDGPGFNVDCLQPGHGLDLLRERIRTLYGEAASLRIEPPQLAQNGATVRLVIPRCPFGGAREVDAYASLLRS